MKSERNKIWYVIFFILPSLLFLAVLTGLTIYVRPLEGDLTRLGYWAERDFMSHDPQPPVNLKENGPSLTHPEILVLGDSFSRTNIWQSYVAQMRNTEILSYYFKDVGCLHNWVRWVSEKPYPSAKTIVIEIVEREFVPRFSVDETCRASTPDAFEISAVTVKGERPLFSLIKDLNYLRQTVENTLTMEEKGNRIVSGKVVNVLLNTGKLFSNRKSDHLLFYRLDENKKGWTRAEVQAAIAHLEKIQNELSTRGLRLLVVVVPDKSTIYRPYFSQQEDQAGYPDIFAALSESHVNTVNLFEYFQQQLPTTVDLYKPNDTHLSQRGYQLMASKLASAL